MAATKKTPVTAKDLQGLKYFQVLKPLLERLHTVGTERDKPVTANSSLTSTRPSFCSTFSTPSSLSR